VVPALSDAVERIDHVVPGVRSARARPSRQGDHRRAALRVLDARGGYVIGTNAPTTRSSTSCAEARLVGVSVEYRLAPETTYPGPLLDCYRGLQWTYEHADELVSTRAASCHGVSAGGGLAAALALLARDRGEPPVAFQLLDSAMLDDRQITLSSQQDGSRLWNRNSNSFGWRSYLGDLSGPGDVPDTAAPARPLTCRVCHLRSCRSGAVDGFRDEDVDYALRLNQAGVPRLSGTSPGPERSPRYDRQPKELELRFHTGSRPVGSTA